MGRRQDKGTAMALRRSLLTSLSFTLALGLVAAGAAVAARAQDARAAIALSASRVSIAGTSNVHAFSAATTDVRVTRVQLTEPCTGWDEVLKAGALKAFDVSIPVVSLKSGDDGMDKNMYKALKAPQNADITFSVSQLEPKGTANAFKATGTLRIAGVEREVALDVTTELRDGKLVVKGALPILMTDYGIAPPKAMLGMLKTDPKVTVSFVATLSL
jgi:polyisoprenoid-binding protein YceI